MRVTQFKILIDVQFRSSPGGRPSTVFLHERLLSTLFQRSVGGTIWLPKWWFPQRMKRVILHSRQSSLWRHQQRHGGKAFIWIETKWHVNSNASMSSCNFWQWTEVNACVYMWFCCGLDWWWWWCRWLRIAFGECTIFEMKGLWVSRRRLIFVSRWLLASRKLKRNWHTGQCSYVI